MKGIRNMNRIGMGEDGDLLEGPRKGDVGRAESRVMVL